MRGFWVKKMKKKNSTPKSCVGILWSDPYVNVYVERNLEIDLTIILIIEPSFIETAANSGWWPANDHISRYLTTLFIWSETIISPIVILLQCNGPGNITSVVTDSTNDPWLQSSKLSRPMNQSGEGTNLVITEIWKKKSTSIMISQWSHYPSVHHQNEWSSCVGFTQHQS